MEQMEQTIHIDLLDKIPVADRNTVMAIAEKEMEKDSMTAKVYNVCGIDVIIAKYDDKMLMMKIKK